MTHKEVVVPECTVKRTIHYGLKDVVTAILTNNEMKVHKGHSSCMASVFFSRIF
jgi:hypothetical protein